MSVRNYINVSKSDTPSILVTINKHEPDKNLRRIHRARKLNLL